MEVQQATKRDSRSCLIVMKHACKFCHKRFTCGRSLGGHMRSHSITNPIDQEKVNTTINKQQQIQLVSRAATDSFSGEAGYELRENPKKTWRAIGSALDSTCDQDPNLTPFREGNNFCCKECGKSFHSSKALYGHMKSHAVERVKEKERLIVGDPDPCNNGQSDISHNRPRRSSRNPRNMEFSTNDYNSSKIDSCSDSEIDQQEQEEVALCLILLSKNVSTLGEISHNSNFFLEDKGVNFFKRVLWESNKSKGFNGDEYTEVPCGIELSGVELGQNLSSKSVLIECNLETSKRKAKDEDLESDKRSKFECNTCNKTFHSHQALGGHRASHKKTKGCSERSEIRVPPAFHYHNQAKELSSNEVAQRHECPICFRVFPSGQALGGHKRSHFIVKSPSKTNVISVNNNITTASTTTTHEARDFLDLNLPALVEEGVDGLKPWSVDSTSKHEQIVGMI